MYRDDKRNGWGKYVWANGDKYIGEWHQGMMHGRGTFSWQKVRGRSFSWVVEWCFCAGVRPLYQTEL